MGSILALILLALAAGSVRAQQPHTLLDSIPPPPTGLQSGARLGESVAMDGIYIVAGAPYDDTGAENAGVVKVFDSTTGALLHVLLNPGMPNGFGVPVAISGARVLVGAPYDTTGGFDTGIVHVYDLESATPTIPVMTLHNPDPGFTDSFGISVAISGTRVVVGALSSPGPYYEAGSVYVYDLSSGTPTVPMAILQNPFPARYEIFGWSVSISGASMVVGAPAHPATTTYRPGRAYVYDLSSGPPTEPVATLDNPDPVDGDQFGISVANSGKQVVVGTPSYYNPGRVYVYDVTSPTPTTPVFTLRNPAPQEDVDGDFFGMSVAISERLLLVGAVYDDTGQADAGSAYVYNLLSGTPTEPVATLNNPRPTMHDHFAFAVALSGSRGVVGVPRADTGPADDPETIDSGSAYIYEFSSATPEEVVATLNDPGPAPDDQFGWAVALSGTLLAVGAPGPRGLGDKKAQFGSAYVYDLSAAEAAVPLFTLTNPVPALEDLYGASVAISGTLLVVGAPYDDAGAEDAGSAYVYDLSSATATIPVATLNNPSPAAADYFGWSVAISGTRIVVGAFFDDTGAINAGSAYVYDLTSATPTVPVATLNKPGTSGGDGFGIAVAISGTRIVVGALSDDTGADGAGSAYVYDLSHGTPTLPVATLNNPDPAVGDNFGGAVAISGTRVVVGAAYDDTGAEDAGSAYVYDLSSATPTVPRGTLNNPGPGMADHFGFAVAISGSHLVVGSHLDDTGADGAGRAYVYELDSATPTVPAATLDNPLPAASDVFGLSVAIDGDKIAVGAPLDDSMVADKGFVYIFGPAPAPTDADGDGLPDSWELTYWPTSAGHGALDDFDHDGYPELLELAFGLNPTIADPGGLPPVTVESGYLTMTIAKQPGVTYEVQSAGTLLPALPESFSPATTTVLIDNATTLKVRDNVLIGTTPARFIRTKVTAAP